MTTSAHKPGPPSAHVTPPASPAADAQQQEGPDHAAGNTVPEPDNEEAMLDEGIEMTFPASDPVAVSNITKIVPDKSEPPPGAADK